MKTNYSINLKKWTAIILVISMLLNCLELAAMAQDEDPGGKQLNGWHVDCFW